MGDDERAIGLWGCWDLYVINNEWYVKTFIILNLE